MLMMPRLMVIKCSDFVLDVVLNWRWKFSVSVNYTTTIDFTYTMYVLEVLLAILEA
jgi:hypothetical protein